jgi:hypothetical protein
MAGKVIYMAACVPRTALPILSARSGGMQRVAGSSAFSDVIYDEKRHLWESGLHRLQNRAPRCSPRDVIYGETSSMTKNVIYGANLRQCKIVPRRRPRYRLNRQPPVDRPPLRH